MCLSSLKNYSSKKTLYSNSPQEHTEQTCSLHERNHNQLNFGVTKTPETVQNSTSRKKVRGNRCPYTEQQLSDK